MLRLQSALCAMACKAVGGRNLRARDEGGRSRSKKITLRALVSFFWKALAERVGFEPTVRVAGQQP